MNRILETIVALRQAGYDHDADEMEDAYQRLADAIQKQAKREQMVAGTTTADEIQKAWPLPPDSAGETVCQSIIERLFPDGRLDKMTQADLAAVGDALEMVADAARGVTARLQELTALHAKAEATLEGTTP